MTLSSLKIPWTGSGVFGTFNNNKWELNFG